MKLKKLFFILLLYIANNICAQNQSFLVLGDIHYDLIENHDMGWLSKKPDDLRQVTKEYTRYTKENWPQFSKQIKKRIKSYDSPIKAILQLGDFSEGLAGSEAKAQKMAKSLVEEVNRLNMTVPWIITKGNHDITGPGAKKAFMDNYIPLIQKQLSRTDIKSANYSHKIGDNLFVCFDPWEDGIDVLDTLEKNLLSVDAKFKFVLVHEPAIPINERCWHLFRKTPEKREKLLSIIAKNKAIVLAAHMHLYSIVRRETAYGPIIQIMCNSVVRDKDLKNSNKVYTKYSSDLAKEKSCWQPATIKERITWLDEESKFISYFKQQDLPGYGILTTNTKSNEMYFEYYTATGDKPYERICISDLAK